MPPKHSTERFAEFGRAVKNRRLDLGMTQEQVADQVVVRANYIGYLERGLRKPSDEICCRLADVLGLERKSLFFLANPQVKDIVDPGDDPRESAWKRFSTDYRLHRRQSISDAELAVLEGINRLGEVQEPRDFLFILSAIRQSLNLG